jgi:hypothetical protein
MRKAGVKLIKLFYLPAIVYEYYARWLIMEITNLSIRNLFPRIAPSNKGGHQISLFES